MKSRISLLAALLLSACAVGPDYETPKSDLPSTYVDTPKIATAGVAVESWWDGFHDSELSSLVKRAIASNPDIEISILRLEEARTYESVLLGTALPAIGAGGAAGVGTGSDVTRSRLPPALSDAASNRTGKLTQVVGFDAFWELDLFGQYRREIEAAAADAEAAAAFKNAVLVAVVGDVSRAYFDLCGLGLRIALLKSNIAIAKQSVDLLQMRYDRGITNELDLALAQREYATLKAQLGPLIAQRDAAADTIAVLLGVYPESIREELAANSVIPALPVSVDAGMPADLLRRRPDIMEAERQLAGATARIGVAIANLFPHVILTGGAGWQIAGTQSSSIWSAGPSFTAPIFDFGTLDALVEVADLRSKAYFANYKKTVIQAVREVDAALADYAAEQDRLANLDSALTASHRSLTLATERYDRGLTDYLNVLDAQRQEYALEDQYAAAHQQAADSLSQLYRSLGGGWEPNQAEPEIRRPLPAMIAAFVRLADPGGPQP